MKKEHVTLMQLESALNNFMAVLSQEEDKTKDPKVWFEHFDEVLAKLIDHRLLAKNSYGEIVSKFDWEAAREALSKG